MTTKPSLEDIKVGDLVSRFHNGRLSEIRKVEKVTKTQITLSSGEKFDREGMPKPRQRWDYRHIEPVTQEHRDMMRRHKILRTVEDIKWEECPTELLERILGMVQSEVKYVD